MQFFISHVYIFLTVFFSVLSQLIIKWKMLEYSLDNRSIYEKFSFVLEMLLNPFIILSIILTLLSGLSWMIAMTKFDISYAYPFTSLGFVLILLCSHLLFNESITLYKLIGVLCIIIGIVIISRDI